MPRIQVNGTSLFYEDQGNGPETIVFAHGLLMSSKMFEKQIAVLQEHYRCIALDFRGQGQSEVTSDGYDIDTLTMDVAAMIRELKLGRCHFVGLSMGGFVGLRLGFRHPELLKSLILLNTSAEAEPGENIPKYRVLNLIARWLGLKLVVGQVMPIMFGQHFLSDPSRKELRQYWRKNISGNNPIGITKAVKGVIEREGVADQISQITLPTLIITGEQDVGTVPAKSQRMHQLIANSILQAIPRAGHSSTIEEPEAVNRALAEFLEKLKDQDFPAHSISNKRAQED